MDVALGFLIVNPPPVTVSTKSTSAPFKYWTLMGSTMGTDAEFDAITDELCSGRLSCIVDSVFPLDRGRDALARMERGEQFGKIVVTL